MISKKLKDLMINKERLIFINVSEMIEVSMLGYKCVLLIMLYIEN
jgi:hypothetical protein